MEGMLYLCATPIGNLEDITLRVLRTLREADIIAAEDTRQTAKLLNHYEIKTPLFSYHEHNKREKTPTLVRKMQEGAHIALVTDAGTPAISDPGEDLVRACHEAGVPVTSLPGPSAAVTALALSGMKARRFTFEGFLKRRGRRRLSGWRNPPAPRFCTRRRTGCAGRCRSCRRQWERKDLSLSAAS